MKKIMICSKNSGNTHKVCSFVSTNSDIELKVLDGTMNDDLNSYDAIVLASGVYGKHVHKNSLAWINSIDKNTLNVNTKVYLFLTWIGRGATDKDTFNEVKHLLNEKGIKLEDDYMQCFGKGMGVIRRAHPDEDDCKKVLLWATKL